MKDQKKIKIITTIIQEDKVTTVFRTEIGIKRQVIIITTTIINKTDIEEVFKKSFKIVIIIIKIEIPVLIDKFNNNIRIIRSNNS